MSEKSKIDQLIKQTKGFTAEQIIKFAAGEFVGKITFANSLGEEDQVILDMIARIAPDVEVFTLDTGRLFPETYDLIGKNKKKYSVNFKIYYPETVSVEKMVNEKGINLFYESVENRKLCCNIRKIEPLKRALVGHDAWICGLRRAQSVTRSSIEVFEWDDGNGKIKVNPLAFWSLEDVQEYIEQHSVDVNPLHKKGFISIGCSSCTRAVMQGEDIRSGRWWWESPEQKECGLHNDPKRKTSKDFKNKGSNI